MILCFRTPGRSCFGPLYCPSRCMLIFFDPNVTGADAAHVIQGWCRDQVIRESILVASKNLYETMNSFAEGKTIKKKEQFLNSLYKYVIRMSTRPTPFGLFSGVGFGRMAEGNSLWPAHASYAKKSKA